MRTTAEPASHHHSTAPELAQSVSAAASKAERKLAFLTARRNGQTIVASSRLVGVHESTGIRWERERKAGELQAKAAAAVLAGKNEIAQAVLSIARNPQVDPRDQVKAYGLYTDVMGQKAPKRTESVVLNLNTTTDEWLAAQERRELAAACGEQSQLSAPAAEK